MCKVCFFISGFDYSGAEIVLDRYLKENKFVDPYFIIIYDNENVLDKYINLYGNKRVFSLRIKHNKNILRFSPWIDINRVYKKSKKIIEKINPHIIYSNNTHEMMLLKKLVKNTEIKSIAHIHDMRTSINSPIKRFFMDNSMKTYDEVLTVSEATKKSWNNDKVKVIYNGVVKEFFIKDDFIDKEISKIGFIGKISKRKGFDILKDAFEDEFRDKMLYIAYGSYDKEFDEDIKSMKEKNNIEFFYQLNENEVKNFYDSIDLLVVPSRQDPLPTVILEAMARGCLVIGANTGGIPELIGDRNLIFEANDVEALKKKILEIISLDKASIMKYRKQLYNSCKTKFSHEKKVEFINSLMND